MPVFGVQTMAKRGRYRASLIKAVALLAPTLLLFSPALFLTDIGVLGTPASPTLWLKNAGNPILAPGTSGSFDAISVVSTAVVRAEGKYLLYYSGDSGSGYKVGLATSSDGKTFLKFAGNPIISDGANASVIRDGQGFRMWYVGEGGIRHATSTDGRYWNKDPAGLVLANGTAGAWDAAFRHVNVMREGDTYKMWYSGGNGDDVRIGYATSPDGLRWTRYDGNPVLVQEASWESAKVYSPCVLRVFGEYQMWYSAFNGQATRICFANSTDGITWLKSPFNPLLPSSYPWESPHTHCPVVHYDGRDYRMWYTGANSTWYTRIGFAESTGTGPFAPTPLSPEDNVWTGVPSPVFRWSFGPAGDPAAQSAFQLQVFDDIGLGSSALDTDKTLSNERSYALNGTLEDGTYFWRVRAWDDAGDESPWSEIWTVKIDTLPPRIAAFTINDGAAYTNRTDIRLSINATDAGSGSGLVDMRHRIKGEDWGPWGPFRDAFTIDLFGSDRNWTVSVEVRDRVNNTGPAANATILVDTTPPAQTALRINDGAEFTRNASVSLAISAQDPSPGTGPGEMTFSSDGSTWTPWEPFSTTRAYDLAVGDGLKTVSVQIRDRVGNTGSPANGSIILDTAPPVTSLVRIPGISENTSFTVSWTGHDALSGVLGFDVEYRPNDGPWTPWLNGTNLTQAAFFGQDGSAYSFRARATDRIGNVEAYPANVSVTVRIILPQPVVAILDPPPQKILHGKYLAAGTSGHPKVGKTVSLVEVSIDGGPWLPATGTLSWTYTLDTLKLKNGMHNITARSYDGVKHSDTAVTTFKVSNEAAPATVDYTFLIALVVMMVVIGVLVSLFVLRGRGQKPAPPAPKTPPSRNPEMPAYDFLETPPLDTPETPPSDQPETPPPGEPETPPPGFPEKPPPDLPKTAPRDRPETHLPEPPETAPTGPSGTPPSD